MKRARAWVALVFVCASAFAAEPVRAPADAEQETDFQILASAVAVNPSAVGAELGAAALFPPSKDRWAVMGPRVGALWAGGNLGTRADIDPGAEAEVWLANAIGPGIGADAVIPVADPQGDLSVHVRGEIFLGVRLEHLFSGGALALRGSILYDSRYQFGGKLGLVLQFSGVPAFGSD